MLNIAVLPRKKKYESKAHKFIALYKYSTILFMFFVLYIS